MCRWPPPARSRMQRHGTKLAGEARQKAELVGAAGQPSNAPLFRIQPKGSWAPTAPQAARRPAAVLREAPLQALCAQAMAIAPEAA
mmetsp:Transcript_79016/g.149054  ORF Transcript_79016/g.149054 Transcript_79016/m.149054 type:complete len:86 (+) Transcript_79016:999-1256(+)